MYEGRQQKYLRSRLELNVFQSRQFLKHKAPSRKRKKGKTDSRDYIHSRTGELKK
jgi:hypothetical protein